MAEAVGGCQCAIGAVVEGQQVTPDQWLEETGTVIAAVLVKVGMEPGEAGNGLFPCHAGRAPAQWPLGCHVDSIRALVPPEAAKASAGTETEAQFRVAGQGQATHAQGPFPVEGVMAGRWLIPLGWADDGHPVAALDEFTAEVAQGPRNTVDLWREGLRHQCNVPCLHR